MGVAPVVEMVSEQDGAHAQAGHFPELRRIGHLAMLQGVAVVPARRAAQGKVHGLDRALRGFIAVGVDVQLHAGIVIGLHAPL
ncbi:hypothetical protein G6F63_016567 [Rhizopus arrhizus]|nr:hypothetical protein G6F63_016567 [Rhizopus arrhizus]